MVDPLPGLVGLKESYRRLDKAKKNHIKLSFVILMLGMGLFFYSFFDPSAYAQKTEPNAQISPEVVDPLNRIGRGIGLNPCGDRSSCEDSVITGNVKNDPKLAGILAGSPMEKMVPALNKRDKEVSSYLIAIAKKESDWGKHSPKKAGKECYNYWGYRGSYNRTESGYSCFDSPEQAVQAVGDRIEDLLNKKVNTPERMVVWKCGGDCNAAGGQAAANKWIADVKAYYKKLNS